MGRGVRQDEAEGHFWIRRAAAQGYAPAKALLSGGALNAAALPATAALDQPVVSAARQSAVGTVDQPVATPSPAKSDEEKPTLEIIER
jgi:TPR repeat protein